MRTFDNFPKKDICPICNTNENKKCFLLPIDGTQDGNTSQAQPAHVDCLMSDEYRLNKERGIIYRHLI